MLIHVSIVRAMHNVLLILLHRPFVAEGHLHSKPSSIAVESFRVCATAAAEITRILRTYERNFAIKRAPYLISYATYVSATIHVRIAAQRGSGSEAHASLATCLNMFKENQETNWAVRRASLVIHNLMKRMKVVVENDQGQSGTGPQTEFRRRDISLPPTTENLDTPQLFVSHDGYQEEIASDLDIDAIIQSFIREQGGHGAYTTPGTRSRPVEYQRDSAEDVFSSSLTSSRISQNQGPYQPYMESGYDGASYWNSVSQTVVAPSVNDDMLFGFNSSAVDEIGWELENRPFTPGRYMQH